MYRTMFFFTHSCEPELAHRLQTSKMRRNSTSLNSCQYDDINIVTVSVARRRWIAPLKLQRPCVKHFTTFNARVKHVSPKGDYFTTKGHYFAHWCEKRPFSLSVNGAQMMVLHACVKKRCLWVLSFSAFQVRVRLFLYSGRDEWGPRGHVGAGAIQRSFLGMLLLWVWSHFGFSLFFSLCFFL